MYTIKSIIKIVLLVPIIYLICCGKPKEEKKTPVAEQILAVTDGVVAYYPFKGNANDKFNNNNGTVSGAVLTTDRFGNTNSAYEFDGIDDYIKIPVNINPEKMPVVTLVAWANTSDNLPVKQVISHDNGDYDRSLGIDERGGGLGWSAFCGSEGVLGFQPITNGEWTFVAAIYNQTDSTVKLYVNDAVFESSGSCGPGHDTTYIGMNPSFGEYFAGKIDDVIIYDRALSKEEIKTLYKSKG